MVIHKFVCITMVRNVREIKVDLDKTVRSKGGQKLQCTKDTKVMSSNFSSSIRDNGLLEELPKPYVWHWDKEQRIIVGMSEETEAELFTDCPEPEKAGAQE